MKKLIVLLLVMIPFCLQAQTKNELIINAMPPIGDGEPLYVLDGKIITKAAASKIRSADIDNFAVLKKPGSVEVYGEQGKHGVFLMISKKTVNPPADQFVVTPTSVFYLDGKKITNEEAEQLNPDDMVEKTLSQYPKGVMKEGQRGNDVFNLISKKYATQAYQQKFSKLSAEYKAYLDIHNGDDTAITYDLAGLIIKKNNPRRVIDLYQFTEDKIKAVRFDERSSDQGPLLTISMIF